MYINRVEEVLIFIVLKKQNASFERINKVFIMELKLYSVMFKPD